jgi:Pyridoxamine 5'-phosphate oxidase
VVARWEAFEAEAPVLAAFIRERMDLRVSYLATLRRDGAPRVNPVTPWFTAGRLFIRMYPGSVKVRALERDPRYSLASAVPDEAGTGGEALVFGTAALVRDPELLGAGEQAAFEPRTLRRARVRRGRGDVDGLRRRRHRQAALAHLSAAKPSNSYPAHFSAIFSSAILR